MLSEVTSDLFGIAGRLVKINPCYRVFYNNGRARYEVHKAERPNAFTLCFAVPYEELDTRTLDYARKTRVENADFLEREVEENNEKVIGSAAESFRESDARLSDMMDFAGRASHSVTFTENRKWF